jgi:integrase
MARAPGIRYFNSRQAYYCQFRGKQHCLAAGEKDEPDGPVYRRAVEQFALLMHRTEDDKTNDQTRVLSLYDRHQAHMRRQGREKSRALFEQTLKSAMDSLGHLPIRDLRTHHVQAWLDGQRATWGPTTLRMARDNLQAVLNWAIGQDMIAGHKVKWKKVELPLPAHRGRDYILTAEEHRWMLEASPTAGFAQLLRFLEATGCRPGEAYHVEAKHYEPEQQLIRFRWDAKAPEFVHKTARKTRKDRVIFLAPDIAQLVESLARQRPRGPLFVNRRGRPWNNASVQANLSRLRRKLALPGAMIAYSYRHTFATRWLLAGGSIKVLAELLGNSVVMLERHYAHLQADIPTLRRLLVQFRQGGEQRSQAATEATHHQEAFPR